MGTLRIPWNVKKVQEIADEEKPQEGSMPEEGGEEKPPEAGETPEEARLRM